MSATHDNTRPGACGSSQILELFYSKSSSVYVRALKYYNYLQLLILVTSLGYQTLLFYSVGCQFYAEAPTNLEEQVI